MRGRNAPCRRVALLLSGLALVVQLGGCGSTRYPAPVRDAAPKSRVAAKPVLPPTPAGYYRVVTGDTLFKIAFENGLDFPSLAAWNGLPDPNQIQAGMLLRLTPPKVAVTTTPLPAPAEYAQRTLPAEPTRPASPNPTPLPPQQRPEEDRAPDNWIWPSRGELLTRFGEGRSKGIDIGGTRGQTVLAAAPGKVAYVGSGLRGYGKLIIIRHGKTLLSAYAHNARIMVKEGQEVAAGQAISEMGDSDTDRVKLHFEIREYGKPVDPLDYLPRLGRVSG